MYHPGSVTLGNEPPTNRTGDVSVVCNGRVRCIFLFNYYRNTFFWRGDAIYDKTTPYTKQLIIWIEMFFLRYK